MKPIRNEKRWMRLRPSSTINYSLLTINSAQRRGISLMEVLASVFVIGVGLLGVLAVIPFGIYQVSKANNADYCGNMLVNATSEIKVRELCKYANWTPSATAGNYTLNGSTAFNLYDSNGVLLTATPAAITRVGGNGGARLCFFMVNPFDTERKAETTGHICVIGARETFMPTTIIPNIPPTWPTRWLESMRGQDDLLYTLHENRRTEFFDNKPMSGGKYIWFCTFLPTTNQSLRHNNSEPSDTTPLQITNNLPSMDVINDNVSVNLLGCYNYVSGDERAVSVVDYEWYANATRMTLEASSEADLDLTRTKYIFVTWYFKPPAPTVSLPAVPNDYRHYDVIDGVWCKVLNSSDTSFTGSMYRKDVLVKDRIFTRKDAKATYADGWPSGDIICTAPVYPQALIVPGVLYHTRVDGVPIK